MVYLDKNKERSTQFYEIWKENDKAIMVKSTKMAWERNMKRKWESNYGEKYQNACWEKYEKKMRKGRE